MKCPNCNTECEAEYVDNGVGNERCTPWGCPECHWVEPELEINFIEENNENI